LTLILIASLTYILRLTITGRHSLRRHNVKAKRETKTDSTIGTDSACALAVCALVEAGLHLGLERTPLTGGGIVIFGLLLVVAAVYAHETTVKVLGVAGLVAFIADTAHSVPSGAAPLLMSVAAGFLVGCRVVRRVATG
jgi:hypothetical protein